VVTNMLQATATEVAMASTATSLKNSSLEGKKFCGGSFKDSSKEFEEEGRRRVEDIDRLLFFSSSE
jgi:hypothetical protein